MKETEKVLLPETNITPAQGRILCKPFTVNKEMQTGSGIILPMGLKVDKKTGSAITNHRYIVVAVGKLNDQIHVREANGKLRDVRRGDEVHWYIPQSAVAIDWAIVTDWDTGEELIMFHESELSGAQECLPLDEDDRIAFMKE